MPHERHLLQYARELLKKERALLVIVFPKNSGKGICIDKNERGILPLLRCLDGNRDYFSDASVADKIVGKAAAMLYVRLGVREVYGGVMTETARDILSAHGIRAEWGTLTAEIRNRAGTDICPMERAVKGICDPAMAEAALREAFGPY